MASATDKANVHSLKSESYTYRLKNAANLQQILGPQDLHLEHIERKTGCKLRVGADEILIEGENHAKAAFVLGQIEAKIAKGDDITCETIDDALGLEAFDKHANPDGASNGNSPVIKVGGKEITARTPGQIAYLHNLATKRVNFGIGEAGTGKTFLAVAKGLEALQNDEVKQLIISRPAVEAGESLGFLPGDLKEKVDPYMRPIFDALRELKPGEALQVKAPQQGENGQAKKPADLVEKMEERGQLEIAPLAFMRGRTFRNAYMILDEAQNTTVPQMKMFLTRIGNGSKAVVNGDVTQCDLPAGVESGLANALKVFAENPKFGMTRFGAEDVVRDEIVTEVINAYNAFNEGADPTAEARPTSKAAAALTPDP